METLFLVVGIIIVIGIITWGLVDRKMEAERVVDKMWELTHKLKKLLAEDDFQVVGLAGDGNATLSIIGNKYLFISGDNLYQFRVSTSSGYYHFTLARFIENTDIGNAKNGNAYFITESKIKVPTYIEGSRPLHVSQPNRISESPAYDYLSDLANNFKQYILFHDVLKTGPDEKDVPAEYRYKSFDLWT